MSTKIQNFDEAAASWDENPARVKLASNVFAAIQNAIPLRNSMHALDFGCGTGLLTFQIAPFVHSVTGADTSQGMLEVFTAKAARLNPNNVQPLPLSLDGSNALYGPYDLIVSNMTLHHIPKVDSLLEQFHACLRPGGALCITDLDSDDGQFHTNKTGVFHDGFDRTTLRQMLMQAGFTDVRDTTAAEVTRPSASGPLRTFSIFLMTGYRA